MKLSVEANHHDFIQIRNWIDSGLLWIVLLWALKKDFDIVDKNVSVDKWHFYVRLDSNAQKVINNALYLNAPNAFNSSKDDCKWKHANERDTCPDPDIAVIMYTSSSDGKNRGKLLVS